MTEDFDRAVRSILGQMIEARTDQDEADERLQDYRAANRPPKVPKEFEDVDAFLDYHHRRQSYENHLRSSLTPPTNSSSSCPKVYPYGTATRVSEAICPAQSTSSCASRVRSLSRVPAARLASCKGSKWRRPSYAPDHLGFRGIRFY
jgi:hypothetical protein